MQKITKLLLFVSFVFLGFSAQAQSVNKQAWDFSKSENARNSIEQRGVIRCSSEEYNAALRAKYPSLPSKDEFENWLAPKIEAMRAQRANASVASPNVVISIPVVVHVIHNGDAVGDGNENISDAQVISQITVMNNDFRKMLNTPGDGAGVDVEVEFCLAQVDPNGAATNGIDRVDMGQVSWSTADIDTTVKPQTIWDPEQYMNMWSVRFTNTGLLGYAQFPSNSTLTGLNANEGPADTDGVVAAYSTFGDINQDDGSFVLNAPYNQGRTMTHEVGHFLGLRHIWGDGDCSADDYCDDTPRASGSNFGCPTVNSCDDTAYGATTDPNDQVENYMDYTDDTCMNIFTQNQKDRILTVMANSPRRVNLATSTVCSLDYSMVFASSEATICDGADATFNFDFEPAAGFTDVVSFTATGPAGLTYAFTPTSANTNNTPITLVVSGTAGLAVGQHTVTITGDYGGTTKTHDVTINKFASGLTATTLVTPADNATGINPHVLTWNPNANAASYLVEIASDAAFTTVVESSTVTAATYEATTLSSMTDYWWRVTASNNCGAAPASTAWTFKTANITCGNVYSATDVPLAISTGAGATYTSTLNITGGDFTITDLNVNLDISHTWDSDLTITLTSPAGTSVLLTDGNGGQSDNYTNTVFDDAAGTAITAGTAPFTGSFSPEGSLASLNGENLLGDWTLTIVDGAAGDGGSLNSWSIDICGSPIPGFDFTVATSALEICEPNDAVYTFTYNTYAGFNEVTTFTATGLPTGTTATFSPATATADGTAVTMTVSGLTNPNIGNYNIVATGTATGGMVKTQNLTLKINSPTFATLTLVSPTDGLIGATPPYTLTWNADANADSYTVELATDAAFTTIIDTATVTTTTYDPTGIVDEMEYFWRVSPTNACGTGAASDAWSFTTNLIECGTRGITYTAGDMPVGPDSGTVTTSNLELFDALITDVNVTLTIEHTWMSDLDVFLISPAGTRVELTTDNGSLDDGYINTTFDDEATTAITAGSYPFTGSYQPEGTLTDFNGENSSGTWTLEITDDTGGDAGNLLSWSLDICGVRAPAFEMTFADTSLEVCDQADVDYTFVYDTFGHFAEETTFSATGLPAGTTATFNPATATATGTAVTMTISGLTTDNIGTHTITATGTASGGMVFSQDLNLKWNSATFNDITLLAPPNGAVNVLGTVDFSWEADASGNADEYVFQLSDVADFSNIVETVTVTGTSYTSTAVAMNTHYFWRVLPSNGCGTATSGTVFEFTTNDPTCGSFDADAATLPMSVGPNNGDVTTSTLDITGAPYNDPAMGIIDINVNLDIDHTWDGDLKITLTSPAGTQVVLSDQHGSFGQNYTGTTFDDQATTPIMSGTAPFTGSFAPDEPLSGFGAESALGTWTLTIVDNANGDGGQLNSWSLDICVAVPDQDFDGIVDPDDNCVTTYNPDQIDRDEDGIGDICDDFIDLQIVVPQGFTPNGDGTNDTWVIFHLNQFPNSQTTVYNRWGNEVFSKRGYNNDWDGTGKNGKLLPAGSYYYIVDTFDTDGGKQEGWVYINY